MLNASNMQPKFLHAGQAQIKAYTKKKRKTGTNKVADGRLRKRI
jgi:hypothetical protein